MVVSPTEEAKDYWSLRRPTTVLKRTSQTPPSANNAHGTGNCTRRSPLGSPSLSSVTSPTPQVVDHASSAAAAAFKRPTLHLVPHFPDHQAVSMPAQSPSTQSPQTFEPHADAPSAPHSTALETAVAPTPGSAQPRASAVETRSADASPGSRRLWFRKKSGGPATSLIVSPIELVDDVKIRILEKYPTSLQLCCDPADLVMTVQQPSGVRLELQPDENMVAVIDRFHPGGMKMNDAVEVGPSAMWSLYRQNNSSNINNVSINLNNSNCTPLVNGVGSVSGSASYFQSNIPVLPLGQNITRAPSRSALHRARSYSHTHGSNQLIPLGGGQQPSPIEEPHSEKISPRSPADETGFPAFSVGSANGNLAGSAGGSAGGSGGSTSNGNQVTTPLSNPSSHSHTPLSYSHVNQSSFQVPTMNLKRANTSSASILLLPKHFSETTTKHSQPRVGGLHATKLVPLTSEMSKRENNESWVDESEGDAESSDEKRSRVSASFLQLQQQISPVEGKTAIVPQIKVLIVEDNPVNQMLLETFMKRRHVRFESAKNGREALDKWKNGGFHLILMDIQLPVMTGLEATAEIRRLEIINGIGTSPQSNPPAEVLPHERISKSVSGFRSPVIIVALTASSDSDDKSEALAAGCNDFLTKPPNFMWLEKKIIEWGCMQALVDYDGWKKWSERPSDGAKRAEPKRPVERPSSVV